MNCKQLLLFFFLVQSIFLHAELKLNSMLKNNMVMQRNSEVRIWGKANPNQRVFVKSSWDNKEINTLADNNGKWLLKIKTKEAGGPYRINVEAGKEKITLENILLGDVWICSGQSNMQMPVQGFNDEPVIGSNNILLNSVNKNIRLFALSRVGNNAPQDTCTGAWKEANSQSVASFSVVGYLFAKELNDHLNIPIGIISTSWGGSNIETWMDEEALMKFPEAYAKTNKESAPVNQRACQLYNAMIAPIINYNIKGVIWYQGESNIDNYKDYPMLQKSMVESWRRDFNVGEFPFFFVQIAPYSYGNSKSYYSALQRESQLKSVDLIPNSAIAITLDIGDEKSIHPSEKVTVAKRLAYCAFAKTYNFAHVKYLPGKFQKMEVKDSVAVLTLDNADTGFSTFGKEVSCFEIASDDQIFYPANMLIKHMQIHVWSDQVKKPVAVRYAFSNVPQTQGYLYNSEGIPVPSFRTDDWIK